MSEDRVENGSSREAAISSEPGTPGGEKRFAGWLILVGSERLDRAVWDRLDEFSQGGARVVAWEHPPLPQDRFPSPPILTALEARGLRATLPARLLGQRAATIDDCVIEWFRELGRRPLAGRESLRSWSRHQDLVLWWWLDLYLYHETPLRLHVRDIEILAALLEKQTYERIVLVAPPRDLQSAVSGQAQCPVELIDAGPRRPDSGSPLILRAIVAVLKAWGTAAKRLLIAPGDGQSSRVMFLTHASMWRPRSDDPSDLKDAGMAEHYLQPVMDELKTRGEPWEALGVGPSLPFRRRSRTQTAKDMLAVADGRKLPYTPIAHFTSARVAARTTAALFACWRKSRALPRLPGLREALSHKGVNLATPGFAALGEALLLQAPWAVRSFHEVQEALRARRPVEIVLYAESSGLGRAALAAALHEGVKSFAIQHGHMYARYYSYEHGTDEVGGPDGCPLPDRTALFGRLARELLVRRGNYPPESLLVTGSPRFDRLVTASQVFDASATRAGASVPAEAKLLIVASRLSALGGALEALIRACDQHPSVWLLIKPHQAESAETYRAIVARSASGRCSVTDANADLLELLHASFGLVTVDSLAAAEALIIGRPVLVLNRPNNLDSLVDLGAALGVEATSDLPGQLERFLFDSETLGELERRRIEYVSLFAEGADGKSTRRIADAILDLARTHVADPTASSKSVS